MKKTSARPADEIESVVSTYGDMLFRLSLIILGNQNDATDEIAVEAEVKDSVITVKAVLLQKEEAPYLYLDVLGVGSCKIIDSEGEIILEGVSSRKAEVKDGKAVVELACEELLPGEYSLVIDEFVGGAKAEQDLAIKGVWECAISVK